MHPLCLDALGGAAAPQAAQATPASPPAAIPATVPEVRELWTGKLYSSSYRVGICLPGSGEGPVRGVLLLRLSSGKVDVYHFQGAMKDGQLYLGHHSGHKFQGQLDDALKVSGKITLESGYTVQLEGQRSPNAELSADMCRPPAE